MPAKPPQPPPDEKPARRFPLPPRAPSPAELNKLTPEERRERNAQFNREFRAWMQEVERLRLAERAPHENARQAWERKLDRALAQTSAQAVEPAQDQPERLTPRRTPGKPPTNDWKMHVARELIRIAAIDDVIPSAAELCTWCEAACGYHPDIRAMQKLLVVLLPP